jgi:predicted transcriptional regulator
MHDTTTMTIRLETGLKDRLDRLTLLTRRSRSFLAAEAVRIYVERELEIMEGIEKGLQDANDGQLVAHHDAVEQVKDVIRRAKKK